MWVDILAFAAGVWLLQQQASLPGLTWLWFLLPLPLLLYGLQHRTSRPMKWFRSLLRKSLWLGVGFFWAFFFAHLRLADSLPENLEGRDIQVSGVIAGLPVVNERGLRFEFDVEQVVTPGARVPAHIQLSWYDGGFGKPAAYPVPDLHPGERWNLTLRLKRPHGNVNPYGFDYEAWLLERNIRATGYVREGPGNRRETARVYRFGYLLEMARDSASRRMSKVLGERPYAGVLKALAIGEQSAITPGQWQVFLRTGVNHLMSISGTHVTMLSGLFFALTYWLWRRSQRLTLRLPARKAAVLAGVLAALAYAMLSGFSVPTQRTLYMLGVVALALWLGRASNAFNVLSLALLAVLLLDPWAVMSPGFWLSFGAVAVILYVSVGRIGRLRWLEEWGRVQWAVTLGLVPALLAMFQQVSLISPVANALAIPLITLVVTPLTLLGTVFPIDFLLLAAHEVMSWCMSLLEWLSAAPAMVWQQHGPQPWTVVAAMCGVLWLLLPRGFPARWLGLVWFAPMFLILPPSPQHGELRLTVLDVGQGLAAVARTRHHALLYDAGPSYGSDADAGSRIVVPYLRGTGVSRLDGMVVSHDDIDHSGGAASVLQSVPVGWTISSLPEGSPMLAGAANKFRCFAGQKWTWDGVRFEMLHPTSDSYQYDGFKDNDRGCVLKISTSYGSVLLPADIERLSEQDLLERMPDALAADVLVVPHHGSRTSSSEAFIRAVHPATAIFTVGYRNRFGHPKEDVVERYVAQGIEIWRSDTSGSVDLRFGAGGIVLQSQRQLRQRYWQATD
ncbi:DNA internalization-related competence protein ComEC/Rec2 [Sulfurimicrobium lacus]|uniref:DNA internalization-related competence protein ComEC/Rec2 n=1 Tax=Sulfurimicrobium lacus TaxID=2715678 RepID=A0A6F8VCY2_9PROT|nr:DNA internalization-related competence protein ComEC/Rec2 [Sulfurimicrobium lacus]BCB27534.1 DNA internalization-related competence protein ComEC/Rec2 [Sulfurimicrobium lacus]